jgi:hypothetical protein
MWFEIRSETDRGAAILAAAYLDDRLREAISARFYNRGRTAAELLGPNGYLGQYAAKCKIAYCLGLYGKTILSDLTIIGKIRNLFAHSKQLLQFTDPNITDLCDKLDDECDGMRFDVNPENPPRNRYLNSVQQIGLILLGETTRNDQPKLLPPRFDY